MTLPQMSYADYYASLAPRELRALADLQELAPLPCEPELILAVERCGLAVDLCNGEIFHDDGVEIIKIGHVNDFEATVHVYMDEIYQRRQEQCYDTRTD